MNAANRKRVKRLLSRIGVHVQLAADVRPLDLSNEPDSDPIAAVYEGQGRPVLVRVPLSRCLLSGWLAFPGGRDSASPFIRTLIEYERGQCRRYTGSPLEAFYNAFQPTSAAEVLGIEEPSCSQLLKVPPAGALFPWRSEQPERKAALRRRDTEADNREHGAGFGYAEGDQLFGPVSLRKGNLEFRRFTAIYESIHKEGFRVDAHGVDNVGAVCLFSDRRNEWKLLFTIGQHRLAALSALGHADVVVQLTPRGLGGVVRRADVNFWPAVRRGYLSEAEALNVFDRIFAGRQPASFY